MWFRYDHSKTPLENALNRIKIACSAAFISAGGTLVYLLVHIDEEAVIVELFYIAIFIAPIITLAFLLMKKKSRAAAVILFLIFLADMAYRLVDGLGQGFFIRILFGIMYYQGIDGAFTYHKIKKYGESYVDPRALVDTTSGCALKRGADGSPEGWVEVDGSTLSKNRAKEAGYGWIFEEDKDDGKPQTIKPE